MSQAPRGKHDWIRDNYEKLILLVALIALLFSCVLLAQRIQSDRDYAKPSLTRLEWKGDRVSPKDTVPFDSLLEQARTEAARPLKGGERTTISEMRVSCVKCGRPIPYAAATCPFCLAEQPEPEDGTKRDTDGDGIPDAIELQWGLNAQDLADAAADADGDGFTNLEEYNSETDPKDPEKFPDPVVKLRVAGIRPVPFYLRFVGTQKMPDGSDRFQLNLQTLERTYFAKLEDVILGYKVSAYEAQGPMGETLTMVRQSDQRSIDLVKGKPVTQQELAILFVFLVDKQRLPVQRLNDVFPLRGVEYKVVDIRRDNVVIQNVKTGGKVTVPLWSPEERAAVVGQPSVPAAAVPPGAPALAPAFP